MISVSLFSILFPIQIPCYWQRKLVIDSFLSISIFAEGGGRKSTHGLMNYSFDQVWEMFSFDFCQHPDHYSRKKSIAEQTVLNANGVPLKGEIFISTLLHWVKYPLISSKYLCGFLRDKILRFRSDHPYWEHQHYSLRCFWEKCMELCLHYKDCY